MANYSTHSFSVHLATELGLVESIILQHFSYWHISNLDNPDMFKDGRVWFYVSRRAVLESFPYLSDKSIRGALARLVEGGYLLKGNYNANKMNRTSWYALTDRAISLLLPEKADALAERANALVERANKDVRIEDIEEKKEINTKVFIKKEEITPSPKEENFDFVDDPGLLPAFKEWLEYKRERKQAYKSRRGLIGCYNLLKSLSEGNPKTAMDDVVMFSIAQNYQGLVRKRDGRRREEQIKVNEINFDGYDDL